MINTAVQSITCTADLIEVLSSLGLKREAQLARQFLAKNGAARTGIEQERVFISDIWSLCNSLSGLSPDAEITETLSFPTGEPLRGFTVSVVLSALAKLIQRQISEWNGTYSTRLAPEYHVKYRTMLQQLSQVAKQFELVSREGTEGAQVTQTGLNNAIKQVYAWFTKVQAPIGRSDIARLLKQGTAFIRVLMENYRKAVLDSQVSEQDHDRLVELMRTTLLDFLPEDYTDKLPSDQTKVPEELANFPAAVVESERIGTTKFKPAEVKKLKNAAEQKSEELQNAQVRVEGLYRRLLLAHAQANVAYNKLEKFYLRYIDPWNNMATALDAYVADRYDPEMVDAEHYEKAMSFDLDRGDGGKTRIAERFNKAFANYEQLREETNIADNLWVLAKGGSQELHDKVPTPFHFPLDTAVYIDDTHAYTKEFQNNAGVNVPFSFGKPRQASLRLIRQAATDDAFIQAQEIWDEQEDTIFDFEDIRNFFEDVLSPLGIQWTDEFIETMEQRYPTAEAVVAEIRQQGLQAFIDSLSAATLEENGSDISKEELEELEESEKLELLKLLDMDEAELFDVTSSAEDIVEELSDEIEQAEDTSYIATDDSVPSEDRERLKEAAKQHNEAVNQGFLAIQDKVQQQQDTAHKNTKRKKKNPFSYVSILRAFLNAGEDEQERAAKYFQAALYSGAYNNRFRTAKNELKEEFLYLYDTFRQYTFRPVGEHDELQGDIEEGQIEDFEQFISNNDFLSLIQLYRWYLKQYYELLQTRFNEFMLQRVWGRTEDLHVTGKKTSFWRERAWELIGRVFQFGQSYVAHRSWQRGQQVDLSTISQQLLALYRAFTSYETAPAENPV